MNGVSRTFGDLELELRLLPGVINVGIVRPDGGEPEFTITAAGPDLDLLETANRLVRQSSPKATVNLVELGREPISTDKTPNGPQERIALVKVEFRADSGASAVHLRQGAREAVGRSSAGPLIGGAEATLEALSKLGARIPAQLVSVSTLRGVRQ